MGRSEEEQAKVEVSNNVICREITAKQVKEWPRNGKLSVGCLSVKYAVPYRLDQDEVHLMYLLQHKIHINWKDYCMAQTFVVRECNRGSSLCYALMIEKLLRHFDIGVPNLPCISPGQSHEFNMTTMRHLGYHWDTKLKVCFYKMKGFSKVIYNYDDLDEFGTNFVDEQHVK